METRANYVIVGAFTLAVAAVALGFGLWAAKFAIEGNWQTFRVRFTEPVTGLTEGSPVLYNGVSVGRIRELRLNPDDPREVFARIQVEQGVPIHEDITATIRLTGLTGTAAIQLKGGSPEAPLLDARSGRIPEIPAVASPLHRLLDSSEGIVATANKILVQVDELLNEENVAAITETLRHADRFAGTLDEAAVEARAVIARLDETAARLQGLATRADSVLGRFDGAVEDVDRELIAHLPTLREDLAATLEHLSSLTRRADRLLSGDGEAIADLGGPAARQVGAGLEELRTLVRDLSRLVRDLDRSPSSFLLGGETLEEYRPQ
ncbi:MAG: MlaD family protein [Wenzhouxiangellaceae bacterium]|nr:MlaD family protein [Wenzhouxiangellaceae bacterium]